MSEDLSKKQKMGNETEVAKAPSEKRSFSEWAHVIANVAVILSAVVALPLFLIERHDSNDLERQQFAAQMFQRKYDEHVMSAYIRVSDAFDGSNTLFPVFDGNQDEAKFALSEKIINEAGLSNIKIIIDYYNDLLVCVDQNLCDREIATKLIGQDIKNFYCKARYVGLPQLRDRYGYPGYGDRLQKFAGNCENSAGKAASHSTNP